MRIRLNKKKGWNTFDIWECMINDKKRFTEEIDKILKVSENYFADNENNKIIYN